MARGVGYLFASFVWAALLALLAVPGALFRVCWVAGRAAPRLAMIKIPPLYPRARRQGARLPGGFWVFLAQVHVNSWSLLPLLPPITIPMRWESPLLTPTLMAWWTLRLLVWFRALALPYAWSQAAAADAAATARFRAYPAPRPRARARRRLGGGRDA